MLKHSSDYQIPNFIIINRLISPPQSFIDNATYLKETIDSNIELRPLLQPLLETNKKTFFHLLDNAFIFEQNERFLTVKLNNWIKYSDMLEIDECEIINIVIRSSKTIDINDYILDIVKKKPNEYLIKLLELFIDSFNFNAIYFFLKSIVSEKNENEISYFFELFSEKSNNKMNFLNLLLMNDHKKSEESEETKEKTRYILSCMKAKHIKLKKLANLQKSRANKTSSDYEKSRFSLRFGLLISSGLYDDVDIIKDPKLLNKKELIEDPHSLAYLFSSFKEWEKEMFIEIIYERQQFCS